MIAALISNQPRRGLIVARYVERSRFHQRNSLFVVHQCTVALERRGFGSDRTVVAAEDFEST